RREPDQANGSREPLPLEQGGGAAVELETVLSAFAGRAARVSLEWSQPELEGHAAGREAARSQLGGHALGLTPQCRPQPRVVRAVDAEGLFGADRLRDAERLDWAVITAVGVGGLGLVMFVEFLGQVCVRLLLTLYERD